MRLTSCIIRSYKNLLHGSHILSEGIERVVPDKESIEEARDMYHTFFTPDQEKQFGVVGIEMKRTTK